MGWCESRGVLAGGFGFVALVLSCSALGASPGQKNDFEDGGLAGWQVGSAGTGTSPTNVSSGGPAGVGDNFMRLTSTGGVGALSKLVVFNQSSWSGPYTGFDAIRMDLANLGSTQVQMRIALADTAFGQHVSTQSFILPPNGQWQRVTFVLDPSNFSSTGNFETGLNNVREIRLLHSVNGGSLIGDTIAATVGVDNIEAVVIPEPGAGLFVGAGFAALSGRRRRV